MTYIVSQLEGLGRGISWRPPAYSCCESIRLYEKNEFCQHYNVAVSISFSEVTGLHFLALIEYKHLIRFVIILSSQVNVIIMPRP